MCLILLIGCRNDNYTPKPRGFERIDFPKHSYLKYSLDNCHYSFDLPVYAEVNRDTYPLAEECWYNVNYINFGATLHLSYRNIKDRKDLFKMLNDSREMVYKHVMRADEIVENYISTPVSNGIFYELDGSTATNAQFYITDSTQHFLRGSLYFNSKTNQDSIAPVLKFLKADMMRLIKSVEWK
ncbi:MAG: gliding motility lipoprotein GldD [Bacteroidia bacterium]|nr:gliding motility lipoprotein GldD [Bacteroidia bacterium]